MVTVFLHIGFGEEDIYENATENKWGTTLKFHASAYDTVYLNIINVWWRSPFLLLIGRTSTVYIYTRAMTHLGVHADILAFNSAKGIDLSLNLCMLQGPCLWAFFKRLLKKYECLWWALIFYQSCFTIAICKKLIRFTHNSLTWTCTLHFIPISTRRFKGVYLNICLKQIHNIFTENWLWYEPLLIQCGFNVTSISEFKGKIRILSIEVHRSSNSSNVLLRSNSYWGIKRTTLQSICKWMRGSVFSSRIIFYVAAKQLTSHPLPYKQGWESKGQVETPWYFTYLLRCHMQCQRQVMEHRSTECIYLAEFLCRWLCRTLPHEVEHYVWASPVGHSRWKQNHTWSLSFSVMGTKIEDAILAQFYLFGKCAEVEMFFTSSVTQTWYVSQRQLIKINIANKYSCLTWLLWCVKFTFFSYASDNLATVVENSTQCQLFWQFTTHTFFFQWRCLRQV